MFSDIPRAYDLSDASFEILFMLFIAFLLGFFLAWILKVRKEDTFGEVAKTTGIGTSYTSKKKKVENLKIIEGVGPKIEELLNDADIYNFSDVEDTGIKGLQKILDNAGTKFQMHNPKTWPDQAELARNGRWGELKEYQDLLNGGRDS